MMQHRCLNTTHRAYSLLPQRVDAHKALHQQPVEACRYRPSDRSYHSQRCYKVRRSKTHEDDDVISRPSSAILECCAISST
jgi:hypothetical protein